MMKFLSLSIALILFSSNAFGICVSIGISNPDCKEPVLIDGKVEFVDSCADDEDCIDGKYCCPIGTKPSRYAGYSGQISNTGESLTCRCPDNKYYSPRGSGTGPVCPDCPETSVWGKTDYGSPFGSRYYDSVNKEGCVCAGDYKYYDTMTGKCIDTCDADVVEFSRDGECCHPEEFYSNSGCLCTLDYLKYVNKCENNGELESCGWENSLAKLYYDHGSLVEDDNRLVRFSDDYGRKGTCANDQCNGELWCDVGVMGNCCPCFDLRYEDASLVNGDGECNYCPEGYIGGHTVEFIKDALGKVYNNYYDTTEPCVKCDKYGGVWYPGSDNPDSDGYTMDSYCVFCPDGTSPDGKGEPYNGVEECRCPYYGQEYLDTEEVKGCFCPPGTYLNLNESEGICSPCGNSDGSDSDEYTGGWNNQNSCSKCSGQQALAIRTGLTNSILSEGNDDCVTCYYQYGAEKPHWNGEKCVPCYEDGFSGGKVWSAEYDENGSCISCFAKNYLHPFWNDELKQCEECPAETPLWSTTAYYVDGQPQSGCVSCYAHHQDILKAYWNPYGFDSSGGICPTNDEDSLDCCTYCDNQTTYDVNAGGCVNCYDSTACQECIAGGTNPAECPCVHNDFDNPGTCMDCMGYCSLSGNGEIGVLDEYGYCSCQNCPVGTVFNSGECIADPSACPEGYDWNPSVECCWDPNMNDGMGGCMVNCTGSTYWNGNCCWDPDMGMCG